MLLVIATIITVNIYFKTICVTTFFRGYYRQLARSVAHPPQPQDALFLFKMRRRRFFLAFFSEEEEVAARASFMGGNNITYVNCSSWAVHLLSIFSTKKSLYYPDSTLFKRNTIFDTHHNRTTMNC